MAEYDLESLASDEFEQLIRDLFQAETGIFFESFKKGKDKGIDLRNCLNNQNTIIQCKHFYKSSFTKLFSTLKNERIKVEAIQPTEYWIATSCELSPQNKSEIKKLFEPYCPSEGRIYGRDDILNLLKKYERIAIKNYKLWFTSEAVLQKIIHSATINKTEIDLENFRNLVPKIVFTDAFTRVEEILEKNNVCLICGQPGLGKSVLTRFFVLKYIAANYEPIKISRNIEEAFALFQKDKPQFFYYDDFLGENFLLNEFLKNEDKEIYSFIQQINRMPNKKIFFATRDYIFNQAKEKSDVISHIEKYKSIITLSDFTQEVKAKILFNHLWFSNIEERNISEMLQDNNYLKIITHDNFNPRIIEWMTIDENVNNENYLPMFLESLNNPEKIWQRAFEKNITESSKILLIVLTIFENKSSIKNLFPVFKKYFSLLSFNTNDAIVKRDLSRSIDELDGTFLRTYPCTGGDSIEIEFSNPSIRDFMHNYLISNKEVLSNLCDCELTIHQIKEIWEIVEKTRNNIVIVDAIDLTKYRIAMEKIFSENEADYSTNYSFGYNLNHLVYVTQIVKKEDYNYLANSTLEKFLVNINNGEIYLPLLYQLILKIQKDRTFLSMDYRLIKRKVKDVLLKQIPTYADDFVNIINFKKKLFISLNRSEIKKFRERAILIFKDIEFDEEFNKDEFGIFTFNPESNCFEHIGTGINDLENLLSNIIKISTFFEINLSEVIYEIQSKIDEYYDGYEQDEDIDKDLMQYHKEKSEEMDIEGLFESLLEK